MPLTPEQRAERRTGIGGSDVAAVLGRHPTRTALSVWLSKVYDTDEDAGERAEAGNRLEPVIREWAADLLGESVSVPAGTLRHPSCPVMLANLDGLLESKRVLECKNIDGLQWRATEGDRVDDVLRHHWWQVQHYMEVVDAPGAVVAYLIGGNDLQLREVPRNRAIGAALRTRLPEWWERHVVAQEPPPVGTPDERMSLLERLHARESAGMLATDAESVVDLLRQYHACRATVAAAETDLAIAKANLCAVIGSASGISTPIGTATWRANRKGTRVLNVRMTDTTENP